MEIKTEYYKKWINYLKQELLNDGYSLPSTDDDLTIAIKYFHIQERRIEEKPRTIRLSKELVCPQEHQTGLDKLLEKVKKGEDIYPHLSKLILDANFQDPLLNDWDIHHFHLGEVVKTDGFVERTGPLLFARVTATDFYAITLLDHKKWTDKSLLEIIHANWPDTIKHRILKGMRLTQEVTPEDHQKLRMAGVTVLVQLSDGTVYAPIGGGITTAKTGLRAVERHDFHARAIDAAEKNTISNIDKFIKCAADNQITLPNLLEFNLILQDNMFIAVEKNTNIALTVCTF